MDEGFFAIVFVGILVLACIGIFHLSLPEVMPSEVVKACDDRGYWQTGQTRVLCSVEKAEKK